ncbi:MAG TPA: TetR/AcrR family transcriptional regulator [Hyphomicrobiaceae bacterium]|nr:TetR/AcrR family transcriptional regulator [Hyphomicrobiaceae bacterium]
MRKARETSESSVSKAGQGAVVTDPGSDRAPDAVADPKRAAILDAARRLILEKGYDGLTTLAVATAANISKRDLYARFASKDALIAGLVADGVKAMLIPVEGGPITSRDDFYGRLAAFGEKFIAEMLDERRLRFYRIAISEVSRNPEIGKTLLREGTQGTTARVGALFGEAQARGFARFQFMDAAIGAYFFALMGDFVINCLLDPTRVVADDERKRHVGLALLLVRSLDGIKS